MDSLPEHREVNIFLKKEVTIRLDIKKQINCSTVKALSGIGRFQKISIPIPRTAFWISEGEGGFTTMEF